MLLTVRRSLAVCACVIGASGCPSDFPLDVRGENSAGSAGGTGGTPVYNNPAGSWSSSTQDSGVIYGPAVDAGMPDASDGEGACGASTMAAEEVVVEKTVDVTKEVVTTKPVTLFIMFDQSQSMSGTLWNNATKALKSFIDSESSPDVSMGIQFFPKSGTVPLLAGCDGSDYNTTAVPIGVISSSATALKAALDSHSASGLGTPIEPALRGATGFCKTYQQQHPGEQCVAVLVTDGKPELSSCEAQTTKLAAIAKDAYAAGVTTFAVGLKGADFSLLNAIAQQGGAPDCDPNSTAYACDVSAGADKLGDALSKIRDTVVTTETHTEIVKTVEHTKLPCTWTIPSTSNDGVSFDPNKVNIRLSTGGVAATLLRADSADACRNDTWYYAYDADGKPASFVACPAVCTSIEAATDAKIDVLLGCETLVPELF